MHHLDSETGAGSTFCFTLPYNMEMVTGTIDLQPIQPEYIQHVGSLKILIAEDDEDSVKLIESYIKIFCKEILKARTGIEAVEVCRDNPDTDIILMDIRMPGISGYEATRQIREFNRGVIIIAQTAYAQSGDR